MNSLYIQKIVLSENFEDHTYLSKLPVIKNLQRMGELSLKKPVTFFVGENGTGKSTLLESIAVSYGFNAEGGTRNFSFSTYSSHSPLYRFLKLVKGYRRPRDGFFLRAESFYNVASYIEELDEIQASAPRVKDSYGGKSLHEQSHGESFLSLVLNRFGGEGVYILDEPEAALSPSRQMTLLTEINRLVKNHSQFIIATHSPMLMAYPDADIFVLEDDKIALTDYKQTEHYLLTRRFLENPEKMLQYLFDSEE